MQRVKKVFAPYGEIYVDVTTTTDGKKSTVVVAHTHVGGQVFTAAGSSKRLTPDKFDQDKGDLIAFARAMQSLSHQLDEAARKASK